MAAESPMENPAAAGAVEPWNYHAHRLNDLSESASPIDRAVFSWYNALANQFDNGDSIPAHHLNLREVATDYVPALAASALMHLVSAEAEKGKVGIATRFERHLLEGWAENRTREHSGQPLRTKVIELAEFLAFERMLAEFIKKGIQHTKNKLSAIPDLPIAENIIASLASKQLIDITHLNAVTLERYVAINATAVDSDGLWGIMNKTMGEVINRQDSTRRDSQVVQLPGTSSDQ